MDIFSDNSTEHTMQYNGTNTHYHFHINYIIMIFRCVHVTKLLFLYYCYDECIFLISLLENPI